MFGVETLTGYAYAGAIVAIVLAQALFLYAGYGVLTRIAGPTIEDALRGE